jgi:hypothetical protein
MKRRESHMVLRCPHCGTRAQYVRGDFSGKWVICHGCEAPFAWRETRTAPERAQPSWGQAKRRSREETRS